MRLLALLLFAVLPVVGCGGGDNDDTISPTGTASPPQRQALLSRLRRRRNRHSTATSPVGNVVLPGDTLYSIAQRFGVSVQAIQVANGIDDPALLSAGQVLLIGRNNCWAKRWFPAPPSSGPAVVVRVGNTSRREVAFTFDAGSDLVSRG
jgi:hypothetical protein